LVTYSETEQIDDKCHRDPSLRHENSRKDSGKEKMQDKKTAFYNFIIAGGGPTGLAASIAAARQGFSVAVLEKGHTVGPLPRGEGVSRYPLFEDLLGAEFFDEKCYRMNGDLIFHSPGDAATVRLPGRRDTYFFEWRQFMDHLVTVAKNEGVRILTDCRVLGPLEDPGRTCTGIMYRDLSGAVRQIYGNAILACDGHRSVIGRHYGVDYERLNCAMIKCMARKVTSDSEMDSALHFYTIGNGDLPYAPNFPMCVAYAFPLGDGKMELGLMLRMIKADNMNGTIRPPDRRTFVQVWNRLKEGYPGFSQYFRDTEIEYEHVTALSNNRMVKDVVPVKGVVLLGDSAGFIDPFGSSGIYSGMAMATFWSNLLAKELKRICGGREVVTHVPEIWSPKAIAGYKKAFHHTGIFKRIRSSYARIRKFEWYVFQHLRTSDRINKRWKRISWLLKTAS